MSTIGQNIKSFNLVRFLLQQLKGDKVIWLVIFLIAMLSLLAVYTGSSAPILRDKGSAEYWLFRHGFLLGVGFVVMYLVSLFDYRTFARISDWLLYLTVPLLIYTLLFGKEINSAARWISLFGQTFQPSDFAKVSLLVYLAKALTQKQEVIQDFQEGFLPVVGWVLLICGLIAPADLSTAATLFMTSLLVMFVGGVRLKYIGGLIVGGVLTLLVVSLVSNRFETWKTRTNNYIASLTDPEYEPPYQMKLAYGAMAMGSTFGKGVGKSTLRTILPNATSDMIFPLIVEEHGTLGAVIVLLLYLLFLFRSVAIVTMSKTFGALLAAGLSLMLVLQALINMSVAVGLLPTTGLPMPMLSMGGTSIVFTALMLGIILSVSRNVLDEKNKAMEATV